MRRLNNLQSGNAAMIPFRPFHGFWRDHSRCSVVGFAKMPAMGISAQAVEEGARPEY